MTYDPKSEAIRRAIREMIDAGVSPYDWKREAPWIWKEELEEDARYAQQTLKEKP